jgi:general secretion pathway protein K
LLAVLWLTAALGAIAFAVAMNVRGEIDRSSTLSDGLRAQYLAEGAVERGILHILWGPGERKADGTPRFYEPGLSGALMEFPAGIAVTEYVSDASRLNTNEAPIGDIERLLLALGAPPPQAAEIAAAIVEWRTPAPPGATGLFDQYYLTRVPSFRGRHASIEEIEELLYVKGMTPELFYGTYRRDPQGRLVRTGGFRDCVSPKGAVGVYDVNNAEPALLLSIGASPAAVGEIMRLRSLRPLRMTDCRLFAPSPGRPRSASAPVATRATPFAPPPVSASPTAA